MPEIPIISNIPTARNEVPIVQRLDFRRVDLSGVASAGQRSNIPVQPFVDAAGAGQATAKALSDASSFLQGVAEKQFQARNVRAVADAETAVIQARADFEEFKSQNSNSPEIWGEEWDRVTKKLKGSLIDPSNSLSQVAAQEIGLRIDRHIATGSARVRGDATKREFILTRDSLRARIDAATEIGDINGVEEAYSEGIEIGAFTPGEAKGGKARVAKSIRAKQASATLEGWLMQAEADPEGVIESLEDLRDSGEDGLDFSSRLKVERFAQSQSKKLLNREYDELLNKIFSGDITNIETLESEASHRIESRHVAELEKVIRKSAAPKEFSDEAMAKNLADVSRVESGDYAEYLKVKRQIANTMPPGEPRAFVLGELDTAWGGETPTNDPSSLAIKAAKEDLRIAWEIGGLGAFKPEPGRRGKKEPLLPVHRDAAARFNQMNRDLDQMLREFSQREGRDPRQSEIKDMVDTTMKIGVQGVEFHSASLFGVDPETEIFDILRE